jgi:hypothetical protein
MAFLGQTFNRDELPEANNSFDPIPAGWYQVSIAKCEVKKTKAGTGSYLNVQYSVIGSEYTNRVVFGMITLTNPNETAETIGKQQLNALMSACGITKLNDTDQLIGQNIEIKVSIKKDDEYGDKNEVKAFKSIAGSQPPMPKPTQQSAQTQAAPAQKAKAPWDNKPKEPLEDIY